MDFQIVALTVSMACNTNHILLNWNVWGLNNLTRRHVVRDLISDHRCQIVYLQESKLQLVDDAIIASTMGQKFLTGYAALAAQGTSGGVILACSGYHFTLLSIEIRTYTVTATLQNRADNNV
jgi:glutamate racemase